MICGGKFGINVCDVLLLFQVGTGKVAAAWIGMTMLGAVNGQYV